MTPSQQDPGKRDLSARLVDGIKSAMGEEEAASPQLRIAYAVVALANLALWVASLVPAYRTWGDPNEDGFSFIPVFYATFSALPVGIVVIAGAAAGHGQWLRRARRAFVIGVALLVFVAAFRIFLTVAN